MRFLFRLDLSLHAGAEKKIWNLEFCNQTQPRSWCVYMHLWLQIWHAAEGPVSLAYDDQLAIQTA